MLLVTNNVKFNDAKDYLEANKIELVMLEDSSYLEILEYSRNLIHKGYKIQTHPLYGSIKPNETLYRSIVLKKREGLVDFNSVSLIEDAIQTTNKFENTKERPIWTESIREDFRVIDFDLISKTIHRITDNTF